MKFTPHMVGRVTDRMHRWSVGSQERSRRNAMIASTALAQRRVEIEEVEEFLAARSPGVARRPA